MPKQDTEAVQARIEKEVKDNQNWIEGKKIKNYLSANSNMSKGSKWGKNDG